MLVSISFQIECLLRILAAALCGSLIGYERESHLKSAGIRTHAIVALASAFMMLISKYGFYDILSTQHISLDPSRIAAGVVTAVGFLGAGVIFTRKMNVVGITTAAGIWATVGIGMGFGAGMYLTSAVSTVTILLFQILFHSRFLSGRTSPLEQITIQVECGEDIKTLLNDIFSAQKIRISSISAERLGPDLLEIRLAVKFPDTYNIYDIFELLKDNPRIKSIDI